MASFSQGNVTFEKTIEDLNVLDADNYFKTVFLALDNKVADIMLLLNGVLAKGFDGGNFIVGLASHIRNVLMAKDPQTLPLLEVSDRQREQYREQAQKCPARFLYQALRIANRCDVQYRQSSNKRLLVELTLIEIAQITQPEDDTAGAGRSPKQLKTLFQKLLRQVQPERGAQVAPVAQRNGNTLSRPCSRLRISRSLLTKRLTKGRNPSQLSSLPRQLGRLLPQGR